MWREFFVRDLFSSAGSHAVHHSPEFIVSLREDAIAIWKTGVAAVDSMQLVEKHIDCDADSLKICGESIPLSKLDRVEVVGAGKAGAGMARGVLKALGNLPTAVPVSGWVNVPEDCVQELPSIHLHPARPAAVNEPTAEGVAGTQEILRRVSSLSENDLCIVLISGGGSALMPAPVPEISLADKLTTTRVLASNGAPIQQLNVVRSQLSLVKGGGLLRHMKAGRVIALIVSDVIGDPLDIIASGPTVSARHSSDDAIAILHKYDPQQANVPASVYRYLNRVMGSSDAQPCPARNFVIGSNNIALRAAAREAQQRGYEVLDLGSENEGEARNHGELIFRRLAELRQEPGLSDAKAWCVLAGGETTVQLAETEHPGKGGRNQEVVLGAISAIADPQAWQQLALLSGGTDGEDGPTDAAGAVADVELVTEMMHTKLRPEDYLKNNDSYQFFKQLDGLVMTGPTHTNVMDLAVGLVRS